MKTAAASVLPRGTLLGERFAIQRALGRGGMATVYEAQDVRLRQRVAVKVLSPVFARDAGAVERFLREARAVVRLRNQHVVRVIDAGTLEQGAPYLVMEYLDGQSLAALLPKCGRVAVQDVVDYTLQALEALAEAHWQGIVHRDLKPANLMLVQSEDGLPQIKVIDFGISKLIGPEFTIKNLTLESSFLGSPVYASPEQLRDTGKVDARTDIWSLGVVMYELLTGRPPFERRSAAALMTAICAADPERIEEIEPEVTVQLGDVVMRCLQKDPEDRYASAQDLARALVPFAPNARSLLSVEHIVRVQSAAPPPLPHPLEEQTTPSMPPTWSSVDVDEVLPAATIVEPRARRSYASVALACAVLGGLAAFVWVRPRLFPASRQAGPAAAASLIEPSRSASPPTSPVPASAELPSTTSQSARQAPRTKVAPAPAARELSALQPEKTNESPPSAVSGGSSRSFSVPPVRGARPARPLDTTNPFAR